MQHLLSYQLTQESILATEFFLESAVYSQRETRKVPTEHIDGRKKKNLLDIITPIIIEYTLSRSPTAVAPRIASLTSHERSDGSRSADYCCYCYCGRTYNVDVHYDRLRGCTYNNASSRDTPLSLVLELLPMHYIRDWRLSVTAADDLRLR